MERPPYFAFYPVDFASDLHVEAMSTLQVGAYMLLLCKAWQADPPASLPSDDQILARLARLDPVVWAEVRSGVLAPFSLGSDGRLHQKRLRQEYDRSVQKMKKCSAAGTASAAKRKGSKGKSTDVVTGVATDVERALNGRATTQTQISSSPSEKTPAAGGKKSGNPKPERKPASGPHHEAIRIFCDRWAVRYGGKYPFDVSREKNASAVKAILEAVDGDLRRFAIAVDRFLADSDQFYLDDQHTLGMFRATLAKWLPPVESPADAKMTDAEHQKLFM